jgi:hypothetical protein
MGAPGERSVPVSIELLRRLMLAGKVTPEDGRLARSIRESTVVFDG